MFQGIQLANNSSDETIILKTLCNNKEFQPLILSKLDENIFNLEATKEIYGRILTYIQNGKSIPSLLIWQSDQSLSEAARAIFSNPEGSLFSQEDVDYILENLRIARNKKLVFTTLADILGKVDKNMDMGATLTSLENLIQKCRTVNAVDEFKHYEAVNRKSLVDAADKQMSEDIRKYAIPTGFSEFDRRTGGLIRKNVLVMASVPGGGKSAMALQMGLYQYTKGYNVCIVTYEMDLPELDNRMYSNVSKVDHSEISLKKLDVKKKKLVLDRYGEFLESSKKGNRLSIWSPQRELTIPQIALELKSKNYDIIYIDYLSLLYNNPKKAMWENLGEHTRSAKLAVNQLNCSMVLLAQLDDETNKVKYAKSITANANMVWTWEYGDKERESGIIEVVQRKSRGSALYNFYLETDYTILSFKDYLGPLPERDEDGKNETKRRKKKDDNTVTDTPPVVPEVTSRGIPKMPLLL